MFLSQIAQGQKAVIVSLNLPEVGKNRLTSLGMVPGTRIRVLGRPLKDTLLIECKGSRLALGRGLSSWIEVEQRKIF